MGKEVQPMKGIQMRGLLLKGGQLALLFAASKISWACLSKAAICCLFTMLQTNLQVGINFRKLKNTFLLRNWLPFLRVRGLMQVAFSIIK